MKLTKRHLANIIFFSFFLFLNLINFALIVYPTKYIKDYPNFNTDTLIIWLTLAIVNSYCITLFLTDILSRLKQTEIEIKQLKGEHND